MKEYHTDSNDKQHVNFQTCDELKVAMQPLDAQTRDPSSSLEKCKYNKLIAFTDG